MKIKIDTTKDIGDICDDILLFLWANTSSGNREDRKNFQFSIDLALKPILTSMKNAQGRHPYVSNGKGEILLICPHCQQKIYAYKMTEILFGVSVLWNGANNEIELKMKEVS